MNDRVLVEDVARLTGADVRHLMTHYKTETETDFARRPTMSAADARRAFDETTAATELDSRIRAAWANYPADRERRRREVGQAAAAACKEADNPSLHGAQAHILRQQAYVRAVALFDQREPEVGSGLPGALPDMYSWAKTVGF
jgi:hypothetical protein